MWCTRDWHCPANLFRSFISLRCISCLAAEEAVTWLLVALVNRLHLHLQLSGAKSHLSSHLPALLIWPTSNLWHQNLMSLLFVQRTVHLWTYFGLATKVRSPHKHWHIPIYRTKINTSVSSTQLRRSLSEQKIQSCLDSVTIPLILLCAGWVEIVCS